MTKSVYKVFKKQPKQNLQTTDILPLHFHGHIDTLYNTNHQPQYTTKPLCAELGPVKYLGIWLDDKLTFVQHAEKTTNKVRKCYFIIKRNLTTLWHISADVAWTIINTCLFSILEYSHIIWNLSVLTAEDIWITEGN